MKAPIHLALLLAVATPACFAADVKLKLHENGIKDEYIVILKPSALQSSAKTASDHLAKRYGAKPVLYYQHALNGFSARMPEYVARQLSEDPRVERVEQNSRVTLDGTQTFTPVNANGWNLDRLDQHNLPLSGTYTWAVDGTYVHAYVIDSGLKTSHADFGGRAIFEIDLTGEGTDDCLGHGTSVAGVLAGQTVGAAKGVIVHGVKVFGCGEGDLSKIIAGVDWVTGNAKRPAVVNMSLSAPAATGSLLYAAVQKSIASGLTYVVAAGNDGADASTKTPANVPEALTVGGVNRTDVRYSASNYGPGVDLYSAWEAYTTLTNPASPFGVVGGGTSFATPLVSAIAAQYLSVKPYAKPAEVSNAIVANATTALITNLPAGSNNRLLYSAWIVPSLATVCDFNGWTSSTGAITTGTPQSSPSHKRLSDPCALRTTSVGAYVTDATPAAFASYGSRFYFYPEGSSTAPITLFRAKNAGGAVIYSVRYTGSTLEVLDQNDVSVGSFAARVWGWNSVELRWSASPAPTLTIQTGYVNGASSLVSSGSAAVGASLDRIESIELGQIAGAASPMTMHFDAFVSRASTLPIGREIRGDANRDGGVSGPDIVLVTNEAGGGALSIGQPDCNEDGGVSGPDIVCVTNLSNGIGSQ